MLFTQIIHKNKQTNTQKRKTCLILQCSALKSTEVQYNSWHTGNVRECTGEQSHLLEEEEEVGDGRAGGQQLEMDFQYRQEGENDTLDFHDGW